LLLLTRNTESMAKTVMAGSTGALHVQSATMNSSVRNRNGSSGSRSTRYRNSNGLSNRCTNNMDWLSSNPHRNHNVMNSSSTLKDDSTVNRPRLVSSKSECTHRCNGRSSSGRHRNTNSRVRGASIVRTTGIPSTARGSNAAAITDAEFRITSSGPTSAGGIRFMFSVCHS
jgi:hypothetical protein